ncbi:MAG TPA: DUF2520 domain-containing protein [Pyrinomonadaceae bacterium]|nr:DUF2520 domain-containing protein [Pyrinomonadaceae bacterium]
MPSRVAVVGAGRLGTALGRALAACGYEVAAVVARRARHAARAASLVGGRTQGLSAAQLSELPPVKIVFITTPDDRIEETAARLAETMKGDAATPPRVALHASGALSSDALAPLRARGFAVGSLHPLIAVSDATTGAESLRRAFFCVEGDARATVAARKIVRTLGARSFTIDTKDKALYHAAAVMTSGHTVALFALAVELLMRCGLTATNARRVLLPLLDSTLENLSTQTPARALTGTFARADTSTVRRHLDALSALDDPTALRVYALLGERSLRLAAENGADSRALAGIARALDEILNNR